MCFYFVVIEISSLNFGLAVMLCILVCSLQGCKKEAPVRRYLMNSPSVCKFVLLVV